MALGLVRFVPVAAPKIACNPRASDEATTDKADTLLHLFVGGQGASPAASAPLQLVGRREGLSACFAALTLSLSFPALGAVLEADDDYELLERVKNDRKKRLQRQGVINSSAKETGYLQELVYKLSKVGKAIDNNDFAGAISVLRPSNRDDWVKNVNAAFTKLTVSPDEKSEVESFNTSFATLISSVDKREIESSKSAFVSSATAFEKWVELTGLASILKGL